MIVFFIKKIDFYGRFETFQYFHNMKPPRHHFPVVFCDGHGIKWTIRANFMPKWPFTGKYGLFGPKTVSRITCCTSLQGKHERPSFMVGHGTKWNRRANIWRKMTKKSQLRAKIGRFGLTTVILSRCWITVDNKISFFVLAWVGIRGEAHRCERCSLGLVFNA